MANTFGTVVDYFGLASANLIPESSTNGSSRRHVCAYNATTSSTARDNEIITETSGVWMNPTVSYRVVGDVTLSLTLGSAFAGYVTNSGSTHRVDVSGYMITSVEVHTQKGEAPIVTISSVSNEGYEWNRSLTTMTAKATPSVKTYQVSIPISARHRPQNILGAITDVGDLQDYTIVIQADPVVVSENGMPCASDLCHGRIEVSAMAAAYNDEGAPEASSGFVNTESPVSHNGVGYKTWSVRVRKELV